MTVFAEHADLDQLDKLVDERCICLAAMIVSFTEVANAPSSSLVSAEHVATFERSHRFLRSTEREVAEKLLAMEQKVVETAASPEGLDEGLKDRYMSIASREALIAFAHEHLDAEVVAVLREEM